MIYGVADRGHDRRERRLADSVDVAALRVLEDVRDELPWHVQGARDHVVRERPVLQLAVVEDHLLEEGLADAEADIPLELELGEHAVDDPAGVARAVIAKQSHLPGLEVHLHLRGRGGLIPMGARDALAGLGIQPALGLEGAASHEVPAPGLAHDLAELEPAVRRGLRPNAALGDLDGVLPHAEESGAEARELRAHVIDGEPHRGPAGVRRPARGRLLVVRRGVGIRRHDDDLFERDAEPLGREDRVRGLLPLPHLDRAREHVEAALVVQLHRRGGGRGRDGALDRAGKAFAANDAPLLHAPRLRLPADALGHHREELAEVAILDRLAGREGLALGEQIFHAELVRVEAESLRNHVHLALVGPRGLVDPVPAEGAGGRDVRVDGVGVDPYVGNVVRPRRAIAPVLDEPRTDVRVCAGVEVAKALARDDAAVLHHAGGQGDAPAVLRDGHELLVAGEVQLDRTPCDQRQDRGDRLDRRVALRSIRAPERRHDHAHARGGELEHLGQVPAEHVRDLARRPDRDVAGFHLGDTAVRLERHLL